MKYEMKIREGMYKKGSRTSGKMRIGVIVNVFNGKEIANRKPRNERTDHCHP